MILTEEQAKTPPDANGWMPIETAPRNEAVLVHLGEDAVNEYVIAALMDCGPGDPDGPLWYPAMCDGGFPLDVDPIRWQPLPNPPVKP